MKGQKTRVRGKGGRRAEKKEVDRERKAKRRCERDLTNDVPTSREMAMAIEQHRSIIESHDCPELELLGAWEPLINQSIA